MSVTKQSLVERLFFEHGSRLRAFVRRRVSRDAEAMELAQEVYVRMLGVELETIRNPEAYMYTVALNLVREHAGHASREHCAVDVDEPGIQALISELPSFNAQLDHAQLVKRLHKALAELSPKTHAAVVMRDWYGLTYEEIADKLGISTHGVKKLLSDALVHCRRRMGHLK